MRSSLLALLCLLWAGSAWAESVCGYDVERLATAIYKAENSVKYPYGIKSIDTHGDKVYARKICINTIRNNGKRWEKAGRPTDYLSFLAGRFCPIGAADDKWLNLNRYWRGNVARLYEKGA